MTLRIIMLAGILVLSVNVNETLSFSSEGTKKVHGRIVRYAWTYHEMTMNDDFIVRTIASKDQKPSYVRIVWLPQGFELPPKNLQLSRLAFIGRGTAWFFSVHSPSPG